MSTTIDEKVVEMRFDNKDFESNVQDTMSTLDNLKQSLNFDSATKGFDTISKAAGSCDVSSVGSAVESVQAKFSALQVVAVTALQNITNSAVNAGKQLISSLSVDNISAGWEKFGNKTTSVATLVAQGYDLDEVNEQLDRLNWYTDETSYNFTDMVSNIAKFTASGRDLEESVTAMEGIANWAALSGQSASTASSAMYQLSQAMSAGYMRLEDYKSVQNASMDTEEFRQKCLDAAVALGTLKDNADGTYTSIVDGASSTTFTLSSFTTGLTEGCWLTSDVMMDVFNEYSGAVDDIYEYAEEKGITASEAIEELGDSVDEFGLKAFKAAQEARTWADVVDSVKDAVASGWMNTFEIIFGDYEEATALWTDLANAMYDVFAGGAEDRNAVLEEWKELGGRDDLLEAFWNTWDGVGEIVTTVKEAFRDIFPATTAEELHSFTAALLELTEKFKMEDETSENLKNTLKGLFAVLDIVKQAFSAVSQLVQPLFNHLNDLSGGVLSATGSFGELLANLDESLKENETFSKAVQKVIDVVTQAAAAITDFGKAVKERLQLPDLDEIKASFESFLSMLKEKFATPGWEAVLNLFERIKERATQVGNVIDDMSVGVLDAFETLGNALSQCKLVEGFWGIWNTVKTVASGIIDVLGTLAGTVFEKLGNADFSGILDLLNGLSLAGIAAGIASFVDTLKESVGGLGDVLDSLPEAPTAIVDILNSVKGCLVEYQTQIKAKTLLTIASAMGILAVSIIALSFVDSDKLSASLGAITVCLADLMGAMAIFSKISGSSKGMTKASTSLLIVAAAVAILAIAMKSLSELDWNGVAKGLVSIAGLSAILVASAKLLSQGSGQLVKGATSLVVFAAAIKVLASACVDLSSLSWSELAVGLAGVGALLAEIAIFLQIAKFEGKTLSTATGILVLSAAIKVLASACSDFGQMSWGELAKGLTSIAALLLEVTAFVNLTGGAKHVISTAAALVVIGAAMKIFASAVSDFGDMSWEEIAKGLVAMGGALLEVAVAVNVMPKSLISIGTGLVIVAAALKVLASALNDFGSNSWEEIAKGLVAMGGALAELAIGLYAMNGSLAGSAALLVATAALAVLTPVLKALGAMSWMSIVKGLVAIAGAFTILGVAGAVLSPLLPTILGLSAAFLLISVGILGLGAGLLAIGAGLSAVAVGITALAGSVTVGATAIVAAIGAAITGVLGLIPAIITKITDAIVAICQVVINAAPAIAEAVIAVVVNLIDVLVECAPAIVDGVLELLTTVLGSLAEYTPQLAGYLFDFLIGVLNTLAEKMPELIQAAVNVVAAFFSGLVDALCGLDTGVLTKALLGVGIFAGILAALSALAPVIPTAMAAVLELGALIAEIALLIAAIGAIAQIPGLSWLVNEGGKMLESIGTAIGSFFGGIVGGVASGISSQLPQIGEDLSAFMENLQPFIDGASSIDASLLDGVNALASTIVALSGAEIIQGLTTWLTGGSSFEYFGSALVELGGYIAEYCDKIKGVDNAAVVASAYAVDALSAMAKNLPENTTALEFWFGGGTMSLSSFAEELDAFAPSLVSYANQVSGINARAVVCSALAANMLFEMAKNLPEDNTALEFWFGGGSMSLSDFAEELDAFAPSLASYASQVSGINAGAVACSALAANMLFAMVENLPENNTALDFWVGGGTMSLSDFADELESFAPGLVSYANQVSGINAGAVVCSAYAASMLFEMAKNLPESNTVLEFWLGGGTMSLSSFAEELEAFAPGLVSYANQVRGLNAGAVVCSALAANILFDMARNLPENTTALEFWFGGGTMSLSSFAEELDAFAPSLVSYADRVSGINARAVVCSALAANILFDMAKNLPENTTALEFWFGGGTMSLSSFAEELDAFAPSLVSYADQVSGLNAAAVVCSALAANILFEMAKNLPENNTALEFWFGGGSMSLSSFADELEAFAPGLVAYADTVSGLNAAAVSRAAYAANILFEMAKNLPENNTALEFWFGGGSVSLSDFADELKEFGPGLMEYANSVEGLKSGTVARSVYAANILLEMAKNLPDNNTALEFWFGGGTISLSDFADELTEFGPSLMEYANSVDGLKSGTVARSVYAANILLDMVTNLPESNTALEFWFGGGTVSLSSFADELKEFGPSLMDYADSVDGLKSGVVARSVYAANILFDMANNLPENNTALEFWLGGGTVSLSSFAAELDAFGPSLMSYATSVDGLKSGVVARSAYAAKTLLEMANNLPENNTALEFWFGGGTVSLSSFAAELDAFGPSLMSYASSVEGLSSSVVANSVYAAKVLFNMAENLPDNEGVLEYWLGGGTMSLSGFAAELEAFGPSLAAYASSVDGLDSSVVSNSVYAAKVLFNMAENLPDNGDISAWFTGSVTLSKLGEELVAFAPYLKSYSDSVSGIDSEIVTQSANAGSAIAEMATIVPDKIPDLSALGSGLEDFGASLQAYYQSVSGVDTVKISSVTVQVDRLISLMEDMNNLGDASGVSSFVSALSTLGEASVDSYVSAFTDSDSKVAGAVIGLADTMVTNLSLQTERFRAVFVTIVDSGETVLRDEYPTMIAIGEVLVNKLTSGVTEKKDKVKQSFVAIVSSSRAAIREYYADFRTAGIYLVTGFANGISSTTYLATAKASAMASAANTAAREALDENSPSKEGYKTGSFFGQGFVNGIVAWISEAGESGTDLADAARINLSNTISNLSDAIDQSMDSEPTIRPVLDLSNIRSGAGQIDSMLSNTPALAYTTSMAGQISSSMREREIQNGSESRELLQAIKGLGKNLADRGGNTYNTVNGVTYDDGSNVTDAVRSLIRAAKIERRT